MEWDMAQGSGQVTSFFLFLNMESPGQIFLVPNHITEVLFS